jgi:hypothetical protein
VSIVIVFLLSKTMTNASANAANAANKSDVIIWKGKLEQLRQELRKVDLTERVTTVGPDMLYSLMAACEQSKNVKCTLIGSTDEKREHFQVGGSYDVVTKEKVRINFN